MHHRQILRNIKFALTSRAGPLAAQSQELPLPYSAPAKTIVPCPAALYLCKWNTQVLDNIESRKDNHFHYTVLDLAPKKRGKFVY